MATYITLLRREEPAVISQTTIGLLAALLVLILVIGASVGGLFYIRRRRRARAQLELPLYNEKRTSTSSTSSAHRRVMIRPSESVLVYQEKQNLLENSTSPPDNTLPEIRITFPEEFDDTGKRTSGRVVVVKIGDSSFGLEPVNEKLPAYQNAEGGRFHSIDLERIGGLVEKNPGRQ